MIATRGQFILVGLIAVLILAGVIYFGLRTDKTTLPGSPPETAKTPILNSPSVAATDSPASVVTPSPEPDSRPAPNLSFQYNALGQLQAIIYPDGSAYTYTYDVYGDKIRETNQKGRTWSYVYDQNHHPISVIDPDGRVSHTVP